MINLEPEAYSLEWVAAWNRADVEAVLAHYADDVVFVSPLAATVTGDPEVHGKAELRAYWTTALRSLSSPPQFRYESFVWDDENRFLLIAYISTGPGRTVRKCELLHFRPDGLIDRGEAFTGCQEPASGWRRLKS
jgi:ketosteroid isomerase-like protein